MSLYRKYPSTHPSGKQTQVHACNTYSATVCLGLVDALHGQHVINARVQTHLIDDGDASILGTWETTANHGEATRIY